MSRYLSNGAYAANLITLRNGHTLGSWKMARAVLHRLQRAQRRGCDVFKQLIKAEAAFDRVDASAPPAGDALPSTG